jgi:uncharacterized membrane protein
VLIVVRPGSSTFQAASLFPVATALFYAALMISARWVDRRESVWTLMLYLTGAGALLSALAMPFTWTPVRMEDLWLFAGIALFGTAGITMMTQAFRFAPAAVVAPFDYTALIWATLMGWLFWGEIPDRGDLSRRGGDHRQRGVYRLAGEPGGGAKVGRPDRVIASPLWGGRRLASEARQSRVGVRTTDRGDVSPPPDQPRCACFSRLPTRGRQGARDFLRASFQKSDFRAY